MAAPVQKTSVLSYYGRKQEALARFGTMLNVYRVFRPYIEHVVSSPFYLAKILDNEPCKPEQAQAVEKAIQTLLDRPREILDGLLDLSMKSKPVTLSFQEITVLRESLLLSGSDSDPDQ